MFMMPAAVGRGAARSRAANLNLGSAPDSWGVWFPVDEHQLPFGQFLDELAEAGYEWLELGPYGYLPTDPRQLAEEVGRRGLKISGGTAFGALHRQDAWEQMLAEVRRVAELVTAVGAHHVVFIPAMFRDQQTGAYTEPPQLDRDGWSTLLGAASELGKILAADYGVRLCVHPHADTHIQTQPEIERFLNGTDSRHVSLCLDTGHVAYGGGDSIALIRRFADRVGYVHLKQMDPLVLAQVREQGLSFSEAVRRGACTEPPHGIPSAAAVISELTRLGERPTPSDPAIPREPASPGEPATPHEPASPVEPLFVIVEHDLYPCAPDVPLPIAIRTREYLSSCGLGAGREPRR
jgi:inosose dehydratase